MARKKVNLAWIADDSARRLAFTKRRKGLMKKLHELAVLCDVKACAIIFGPHELYPKVWPSVQGAMEVLACFKSLPGAEQGKKAMNQEGFLRQRIAKLQEQIRKEERENRELAMTLLMYEGLEGRSLDDVGIEDLTSLSWMVEGKMKAVQDRIELVNGEVVSMAIGGKGMLHPYINYSNPWP